MPIQVLRGRTVSLELAIVQDKGSGYMNGGRPFLAAILASALSRNNVAVRPELPGRDRPPATHTLGVIVDVLGIVRERQDWLVSNRERTRTIASMEFVVSPHAPGEARTIRRVSYDEN